MDVAELRPYLIWCDKSLTLRNFLQKYDVPNVICAKERNGGCIQNSSSTTNENTYIVHKHHTAQYVIGEDVKGQEVRIHCKCENKLLVCPLPTYCRYDELSVKQLQHVFPNVKYFRVLNRGACDIKLPSSFKPESIVEIEYVDSKLSVVKFRDIDVKLSFDIDLILEPLMDFQEYFLEDDVHTFGLPVKVHFLPGENAGNSVSRLGKVTITRNRKSEEFIIATKINSISSRSVDIPVKCELIPKNSDMKVLPTKGCVGNDSGYLDIVRSVNKTFLDDHDLSVIHSVGVGEFHYNTQPLEVIHFELFPKGVEEKLEPRNNLAPKGSPRSGTPGLLPTQRETRGPGNNVETDKTCKQVNNYYHLRTSTTLYDEKHDYLDYHIYESMGDSDDEYEDVDYVIPHEAGGPSPLVANCESDVQSHTYVNLTSSGEGGVTSSGDGGVTSLVSDSSTSSDYVNMNTTSQLPVSEKRVDNLPTTTSPVDLSRKLRKSKSIGNHLVMNKVKIPGTFLSSMNNPLKINSTSSSFVNNDTKRSEMNSGNHLETKEKNAGGHIVKANSRPPTTSCGPQQLSTTVKTSTPPSKIKLRATQSTPSVQQKFASLIAKDLTTIQLKKSPRQTSKRPVDCRNNKPKLPPISPETRSGKLPDKTKNSIVSEKASSQQETTSHVSGGNVARNEVSTSGPIRGMDKRGSSLDKTDTVDKHVSEAANHISRPTLSAHIDRSTNNKNKALTRHKKVDDISPNRQKPNVSPKPLPPLPRDTHKTPLKHTSAQLTSTEDCSMDEINVKSSMEIFQSLDSTNELVNSIPRVFNDQSSISLVDTENVKGKNPLALDDKKSSNQISSSRPTTDQSPIISNCPSPPPYVNITKDEMQTSQLTNDIAASSTPQPRATELFEPKARVSNSNSPNPNPKQIKSEQNSTVPSLPNSSSQLTNSRPFDENGERLDSIPQDLGSLSVQGVCRLLNTLNMSCYVDVFRHEQIDGEILKELDRTSLQSLNILPFHAMKLSKVINGWRPNL